MDYGAQTYHKDCEVLLGLSAFQPNCVTTLLRSALIALIECSGPRWRAHLRTNSRVHCGSTWTEVHTFGGMRRRSIPPSTKRTVPLVDVDEG